MIKYEKHFRFNNQRKHPSYVFKEKNDIYHSIIITYSSNIGKNIKLRKNPNRNDYSVSYFVPRVYVDKKSSFGKKYPNWKLSCRDKFKYYRIRFRYRKSSTIFVGQYPTTKWHTRLGGGAHADSILDRIVHNIIIIESGSINMRELLDLKKYKHQI